jgi:hypothetical protein
LLIEKIEANGIGNHQILLFEMQMKLNLGFEKEL